MLIILDILLVVVGFFLLIKGADYFVEGAAALAHKAGIPEIVVGLTVVAFGTSAPEAAVSISSALQNSADLAVGNVLGSNILNVWIILGITAAICTLKVKSCTVKVDIPFMIFCSALLLGIGIWQKTLGLVVGILFLVLLFGYVVYLIIYSLKTNEEPEEKIKPLSGIRIFFYIVCGMAVIVIGSNVAVEGAKGIASLLGISERIIGLTVVAFGTSLPELVTSVTAARKNSADIAIGNIVGSNLFNILFVLGLTCVIHPTPFTSATSDFTLDGIVTLITSITLFLAVGRKKELRRPAGILMILMYCAYLTYMIVG